MSDFAEYLRLEADANRTTPAEVLAAELLAERNIRAMSDELDKALAEWPEVNKRYSANMTPEHREQEYANGLSRVLPFIPADQHAVAQHRIRCAVDAGWVDIGVWESWSESPTGGHEPNPATVSDLFGNSPVTGFGEFLGEGIAQ